MVLRIHGALLAPTEPAAEHPGEAGGAEAEDKICGFCGKTETMGSIVVYDGCERGFHLSRLRQRDRNRAIAGDWICGECALMVPTKNRWVFGAKDPRRLLDINQPPPMDVDSIDEHMSYSSYGRSNELD